MTMPNLSNCPHQGEGWCLQCVGNLQRLVETLEEYYRLKRRIERERDGEEEFRTAAELNRACMRVRVLRNELDAALAGGHPPEERCDCDFCQRVVADAELLTLRRRVESLEGVASPQLGCPKCGSFARQWTHVGPTQISSGCQVCGWRQEISRAALAGGKETTKPRTETCTYCGNQVAEWVDPEWSRGRICKSCEAIHQPSERKETPHANCEITRLSATDGEKGHLAERIISRVPALLSERALLVAVAEAAEESVAYALDGYTPYKEDKPLIEALAAWRAARDGVPAAGGAGKEQS